MFRIRRIYDDILPINQEALRQIKEIMRTQFDDISEKEVESIGEKLRNPSKQQFRSILFEAESLRRKVLGFALLLHEPRLQFCFLDWIATTGARIGGGLGGALYEQVRMEASVLGARGLFFECLPDDFENCPQESLLKGNRSRLRFYERYGARPLIKTEYETPVNPGDTCMPHLVFDGLDRSERPSRDFTSKAVRALLKRKYAEYCPPGYVNRVVASIKDDPVQLRPFRYVKPEAVKTGIESRSAEQIALIINDQHGSKPPIHGMTLGYEVKEQDVERIRKLVEITGFFSAEEIEIAAELVSERLAKGMASGYFFIMAEHYGRLIGYACYGPISGTASAFDLYWIAVYPDYQGKGLGQKLLRESEHLIKQARGTRIYVDTSQRIQYASTRAFYESRGYRMESILPDFYSPGDGKVIYCKVLV